MNDEYLWQKTGDDPDVKRLEETLAVFRYRETGPPMPPIVMTETAKSRWRLVLAFAAPAFAALVIAAFWLQSAQRDDEVTFVYAPETDVIETKPAENPPPAPQPAQPERRPTRRGVIEVQSATFTAPRKRSPKVHAAKASTASLTAEERYAYDQLMLALSISSSKLSIVRDTINGVEQQDDAPRQNNR